MSEVKTTTIRRFWDHSSKPSVFVETTDGVETYRGPFAGAKADTHAERQKEIEELRRERDEAREALQYIAHSGLSARFLEDFAREFLKKGGAAK
jgi:pyridoxine 5'-phosphate synthase PdxJ